MSNELWEKLFWGFSGFGIGMAFTTWLLLRAFKADIEEMNTKS